MNDTVMGDRKMWLAKTNKNKQRYYELLILWRFIYGNRIFG